ncbi:hypothetical protein J1N35_012047 [Gossypium stocksii]|uniref:Uncharacterized protein n=1 Tax=Gossypium stocksii TaxID=47602 RepID=A0A9D3W348_9ROSI|nr:hypothetical protein J1N35_012047 [Gossypium stocksii]
MRKSPEPPSSCSWAQSPSSPWDDGTPKSKRRRGEIKTEFEVDREAEEDAITAFNIAEEWNSLNSLSSELYEIYEGMEISGSFQVAAIIEKLPPAWNDFMNYLKHKKKEMTVKDLIVGL